MSQAVQDVQDVPEVDPAAARCVQALASVGQTVATAESLTAGLLVATMASVPGASTVLRGGLAAYARDVKVDVLGVDATLISQHGVYSAACAEQMAERAQALLRAHWAMSTTGVAGPDPDDGHPVGDVHVAVVGPVGGVVSRALSLSGGRREIREGAVRAALDLLLERLTTLRDHG